MLDETLSVSWSRWQSPNPKRSSSKPCAMSPVCRMPPEAAFSIMKREQRGYMILSMTSSFDLISFAKKTPVFSKFFLVVTSSASSTEATLRPSNKPLICAWNRCPTTVLNLWPSFPAEMWPGPQPLGAAPQGADQSQTLWLQLLLFRRELLKQQYSGSWHQIEQQYEKMKLHWKEYKQIWHRDMRYLFLWFSMNDIETQSAKRLPRRWLAPTKALAWRWHEGD